MDKKLGFQIEKNSGFPHTLGQKLTEKSDNRCKQMKNCSNLFLFVQIGQCVFAGGGQKQQADASMGAREEDGDDDEYDDDGGGRYVGY